jgi:hypothetical protein
LCQLFALVDLLLIAFDGLWCWTMFFRNDTRSICLFDCECLNLEEHFLYKRFFTFVNGGAENTFVSHVDNDVNKVLKNLLSLHYEFGIVTAAF